VPGYLRLGIKLDRASSRPVGVDPCTDPLELVVQVGLDLLSAVELPAGAMHPADLPASRPSSRQTSSQPTALSGRPAASMNSATPEARESGHRGAGV
jgi:hypothetical protein